MFLKIASAVSGNVTYILSAILLATATCFSLKILVEYFLKLYNLWYMSRKLPGPTGLPVLGNVLDLMGDTEDLLKRILQWTECYASPFRVWLGPKLHISLYDPDSIKELLQNQKVVEKSELYSFWDELVENGLLTAPVKEWRVHRKLINTVFNNRVLAPYAAYLAEKSQEMVKEMEAELHGEGFEIRYYISDCILKMIFGVTLGTSLKFEAKELYNYRRDMDRYLEISFYRAPRIWLHPKIIFNRTSLGRESSAAAKRLLATTERILQRADIMCAKSKLSADRNDATESAEIYCGNIPGLYMNLPRDRDDFTYQDFSNELNTIIEGGSHTLFVQMDFMTRMLAYHPNIQDKVYEELRSIYASEDPADRPVEIEDLPRMEYLERVIHETMRLFPAISLIERGISKDVDIGSCVLPAGSTALIMILKLHRSEKFWPNPLKFDPDRFLPENVAKRHPGTYIPFSIGPRNCIGGKYAMMAAKIFAATLLRRYILRADVIVPTEKIRLKTSIALECVEPWKMHIEERNPVKVEAKHKVLTKDS